MSENPQDTQSKTKSIFTLVAPLIAIAAIGYSFAREDALAMDVPFCSDAAMKETVESIVEKEFQLEVLKLQIVPYTFPPNVYYTADETEDAFDRETCIGLLYSNAGRTGLKIIAWKDSPDDEVFVEIEETTLSMATRIIKKYGNSRSGDEG